MGHSDERLEDSGFLCLAHIVRPTEMFCSFVPAFGVDIMSLSRASCI